MTNAEAWFNKSLRPRKPEGSLRRTAQDGHLDSHTAPELWGNQCLQFAHCRFSFGTFRRPPNSAARIGYVIEGVFFITKEKLDTSCQLTVFRDLWRDQLMAVVGRRKMP